MQCARLVLEYVKVLLSSPVIFGLISLVVLYLFKEDIREYVRWLKIRLPGGTEVSRSQSERQIKEGDKPPPRPDIAVSGLPTDLTQQQREAVEGIIRAERATSYLWEYRYLNWFLVYRTQLVLDWLVSLPEGTTTYRHYDATWLPRIPSPDERDAIIRVLAAHHLIEINDGVIQMTPKGREYHEWRGPLPELRVTNST
jgi:hypothetical protein